LQEAIFSYVDPCHRNVEPALGEILREVLPLEGNEAKTNVKISGKLVSERHVVADQFAS
jgi:hypothetical protein